MERRSNGQGAESTERVESMRSKEEEEKRGRQWTERETVEESLSLSLWVTITLFNNMSKQSN